jgi:hypothetical protein
MCHRSSLSYARVAAAQLAPAIPMVQLACSGAVIDQLTTTGQYGEPAQIPATPRHALRVWLTIGGNDAGFASVLTHCLTPGNSCESYYSQTNSATFTDNLDARIESLAGPLTGAYTQLQNRVPGAQIQVLTYPNIFSPTTSGSSCLFKTGLGIDAQDVEWLISESQHLDNVIARAVNPFLAPGGNFSLADERYAFAGGEVCSGSADVVNGLMPSGILSADPGSFHPNQAGYAREAADLVRMGTSGNWQHYTTLRDRLPGTPDRTSALKMLSLLATGTYNGTGYSRAFFQLGSAPWLSWAMYAGCTTAQLTLLEDSEAAAFSYPIAAGTCPGDGTYAGLAGPPYWHTPYDNPSVLVTPTSAAALLPTADHIVPLKDAYANGASAWTQGLAIDFANDWYGIELVTASAQTNNCTYTYPNGKCDQSIEEWQPPNPAYVCAYAELWVAIKYEWNLRVDNVTAANLPGRPGNGYTEAGYLSAILNNTAPNGCAS